MTRSRQGQAPERWRSEHGSALIISLLSTTLLLVLGSALALVAQSESAIAANAPRDAQTLYAAEAALRHAAVDLEALPDWSMALGGVVTSTFTDGSPGGVRSAGPVDIDLTVLGATLNAGAASLPFGANNPQWRLYLWGRAEALLVSPWTGYVAVWVADDASETDDDPQRDGGGVDERGRGVVRLRAVAFGGANSQRAVEATVERATSGRVTVRTSQAVP